MHRQQCSKFRKGITNTEFLLGKKYAKIKTKLQITNTNVTKKIIFSENAIVDIKYNIEISKPTTPLLAP